ncbi:hypothetical protein BJX65DRAFT_120840 [Aspergillus insuetus]
MFVFVKPRRRMVLREICLSIHLISLTQTSDSRLRGSKYVRKNMPLSPGPVFGTSRRGRKSETIVDLQRPITLQHLARSIETHIPSPHFTFAVHFFFCVFPLTDEMGCDETMRKGKHDNQSLLLAAEWGESHSQRSAAQKKWKKKKKKKKEKKNQGNSMTVSPCRWHARWQTRQHHYYSFIVLSSFDLSGTAAGEKISGSALDSRRSSLRILLCSPLR